ncbi:MAG: hypothetical protein NZ954_01590 [Thermofilaceae archaeon]|nr:hypothetical protein [Thermofilaceae archaeon]MCX8180436.1 hypothetical protein [Thermofilaceae archaeon]MDW8003367.1 hypothetical protein [Thermofilaceae archaeon]
MRVFLKDVSRREPSEAFPTEVEGHPPTKRRGPPGSGRLYSSVQRTSTQTFWSMLGSASVFIHFQMALTLVAAWERRLDGRVK